MSGVEAAAAGLALALSFALLATRRVGGAAWICAAQTALVALAALAAAHPAVALIELGEAAAWPWLMGRLPDAPRPAAVGRWRPPVILAAGLLAASAAAQPGAGLPLAVVMLGVWLLAAGGQPRLQVIGVIGVQNSTALAGLIGGAPGWALALAVMPLLPLLAIGGLWPGVARLRTLDVLTGRRTALPDAIGCSAILLAACVLPWQASMAGAVWRLDPLAALAALLIAGVASAASWSRLLAAAGRPAGAADPLPQGARLVVLAGSMLAVLSAGILLAWLGLFVATVGCLALSPARGARAWRALMLGCAGLGLALFGSVVLAAGNAPILAGTSLMVGYGTLATMAPELLLAGITLTLRLRPALGTALDPALAGSMLIAAGLVALLSAALGLAIGGPRRRLPLAGLGQGGLVVLACGLGGPSAALAGTLQLALLALTQSALLLSREGGLDRLVAMAGLAGVPPFGLFPGLALILAAAAARSPWLLLPLGAGVAGIAGAVLTHLPARRPAPAAALPLAWLPLALLLLLGFAMPDPVLAWLRTAAAELP
jgi:hydrogenase-4 component F